LGEQNFSPLLGPRPLLCKGFKMIFLIFFWCEMMSMAFTNPRFCLSVLLKNGGRFFVLDQGCAAASRSEAPCSARKPSDTRLTFSSPSAHPHSLNFFSPSSCPSFFSSNNMHIFLGFQLSFCRCRLTALNVSPRARPPLWESPSSPHKLKTFSCSCRVIQPLRPLR